jgi:hypothetical protein
VRRRLFGQFAPAARLISAFRSIVDVGTIDPRIAVFWILRVAGQLNQSLLSGCNTLGCGFHLRVTLRHFDSTRRNPVSQCQPVLFGQLIQVDGEQAGCGCLQQSALNGD